MNENDFEEFFRNKLLKHASPVPGDMWERIQRKKDKDRKGFFFRYLLPILVLMFLTAGYFMWHSNKKSDNANTGKIIIKSDTETQHDSLELPNKAPINNPIKNNTDSTLVTRENKMTTPGKKIGTSKKAYANTGSKNKSRASRFFTAGNIYRDKYAGQQEQRLAGHVITPGSKDSAAANIPGVPVVPAASPHGVDVIGTKKPVGDSGISGVTSASLAKDTSLKKVKLILENKAKKANVLPPLPKWFAEAYASPDIPFNVVTSNDPNLSGYIKKNYKMLVSYSAGVLAGKYLDRHFSIKAGIQYSQINTEFGNSNNGRFLNKYKNIDIPVLIGFKFGHDDFTTAPNAGIIFNLYTWYKGISLDSNGNVVNFYKQNTGASLYFGWSFAKKLNRKMQLFGAPYFRYRFSWMTKPQSTFNQKINGAGILFGLRHDF